MSTALEGRSVLLRFQDPNRILLAFPSGRLNVIPDDPSDNMFIECAAETGADYLISGDRHLKKCKSFQGIQIVSPREYLSRLREE
jgi:predicted nucleic acid-binding protein